jgi:excisionase family DNA binding protein
MAYITPNIKPVDSVDRAEGAPRLLRVEEVARTLAISRSMAFKIIATGELRALRIGRAVRIRQEDLQAFIAEAIRED